MVFAEDLPPFASDDFAPVRLTGNRRAWVLVARLTRGAEIDGGDKQASQVPGEPQGDRADF